MYKVLIFLLIAFGFTALVLAIMFLAAKINKNQEQRHLRAVLKRKVSQYRLSKMLSYIGIRLDDYVERIPRQGIENHIARCKACPDIPTCDRCLRDGEYVSDMNFCPNYQSLMAYSKIMPPVE